MVVVVVYLRYRSISYHTVLDLLQDPSPVQYVPSSLHSGYHPSSPLLCGPTGVPPPMVVSRYGGEHERSQSIPDSSGGKGMVMMLGVRKGEIVVLMKGVVLDSVG